MDLFEKKGTIFEMKVAHRLEQQIASIVINHFEVFSFSLNRMTPIDVLVFVGDHIFVLELKSFGHRLSGNYSDRVWVGTSYMRSYSIFNPIIQVKEKMRSLQRKFRNNHIDVGLLKWHYFVVVSEYCRINADTTIVKHEEDLISLMANLSPTSFDPQLILKRLMTGVE